MQAIDTNPKPTYTFTNIYYTDILSTDHVKVQATFKIDH